MKDGVVGRSQRGYLRFPVPLSTHLSSNTKAPALNDLITIRGARTHNLKNIDCDLSHGKLTVISGVSGSGKSSLAFDTIYAEGQRRYVESLSAYARQFLERIEKPDVDLIDGLAPAIAIKQKNSTRNPRSTVATATEIYDYLRLLFARCGTAHCIVCGGVVRRDTVDEIAASILALGEGTRLYALFPVQPRVVAPGDEEVENPAPKRRKKTSAKPSVNPSLPNDAFKARLSELRARGFNRLYQNGKIVEFAAPESLLELDFGQAVFALVDRLVVSSESRARIVDAAEIGFRESGEIVYETVSRDAETQPQRRRFSQAFECKTCHRIYREPEPRLFSFNNPYGACQRCQGFGNTIDFDINLIIPDKQKTLDEGAIDPWTRPKYRPYQAELRKAARQHGIPLDTPWAELTAAQQDFVLDGHGTFLGVHGFFAYLERKKYKLHVRVMLSKYRGYAVCPDCKGTRLRAEARAVRINGNNICEVAALTIREAHRFFESLTLTRQQQEIAGGILVEIQQRLHFLDAVGLEYITLDRLASTLSGGEAQRIQLATCLGSRLVGACYVLDEPSIGLHSRDTGRLIRILEELRDLGNTIVVVEHDPEVMRAADHIVDMGPGAGETGGRVIASGTVREVEENPDSLTGRYLSGQLTIPIPTRRREPMREKLVLRGARIHNLTGLDVEIPMGMLVCITGVSGSGKSTLVHDVLYPAVAHALGKNEGGDPSHLYRELKGAERLNDIVLVDQAPIGRTPRSNPVTYIKAFDAIREVFAATPDAKRRGFSPGHFSFNIPGGRCEVCQGDGTVTVEMQFLADIELICDECKGTRFKASVLEIKYKGKNIHEVLQLTIKEALRFFTGQTRILEKLAVLDEVGLGYVRLGQSATTLSGGEAQRVKLAAHLSLGRSAAGRAANGTAKKAGSRVLYILDEPTTGLHFDDVSKLLTAFKRLIDAGGSLVVIEHNLDVIKSADWVIDLGPEAGAGGGHVVAAGTPEQVAQTSGSHTGYWLGRVLAAQEVRAER